MRYLRPTLASLFVLALSITTGGLYSAATVAAQQKELTTQDGSKTGTTPTGYATGTKCTKTGTYKASNKFMEVIIVVGDGEDFPPFADGQKTTWYELTPSTRSSFEAIKVSAGSN